MSRARDFANLAGSSSNISTVAADSSTLDQVATSYGAGGITGKSLIINGAMQVAQRGTSATVTTSSFFVLDRWITYPGGGGGVATASQETFTLGQTDVPNEPEFFLRQNQTTGGTNANIQQRIEDVRTLAGQTATLSFYAKVASGTLSLTPNFRQSFGSGGSSNVDTTGSAFTITTSWQKFNQTITLPSISGKTIGSGNFLAIRFEAPDSTTFDISIAQVQLEVGEQATPFEHRSYGDELARCQRYYATSGIVLSSSTPSRYHNQINLPVTMRIQPTITAGGIDAGSGASIVPTWDTSNTPYSGRTFYQGTNHSTISNSRWNFDAEL